MFQTFSRRYFFLWELSPGEISTFGLTVTSICGMSSNEKKARIEKVACFDFKFVSQTCKSSLSSFHSSHENGFQRSVQRFLHFDMHAVIVVEGEMLRFTNSRNGVIHGIHKRLPVVPVKRSKSSPYMNAYIWKDLVNTILSVTFVVPTVEFGTVEKTSQRWAGMLISSTRNFFFAWPKKRSSENLVWLTGMQYASIRLQSPVSTSQQIKSHNEPVLILSPAVVKVKLCNLFLAATCNKMVVQERDTNVLPSFKTKRLTIRLTYIQRNSRFFQSRTERSRLRFWLVYSWKDAARETYKTFRFLLLIGKTSTERREGQLERAQLRNNRIWHGAKFLAWEPAGQLFQSPRGDVSSFSLKFERLIHIVIIHAT